MNKRARFSKTVLITATLLLVLVLAVAPESEIVVGDLLSECTAGVNHASVNTHNSPVLWKVLDTPPYGPAAFPDDLCMTVKYYSKDVWDAEYNTIAIVYYYDEIKPHKYITGGLTEAGIGGGHTWAPPDKNIDIPKQSHLLYDILGSSGTMDEIRAYLEQGAGQGMYQESGCYAFIDNDDNATMFEVDVSLDTFREYDTMAPAREGQGLQGFVVRANEFHHLEDGMDDTSIPGRYWVGTENTLGIIRAGELNEQSAVQSASDDDDNEYRLIRQNDLPDPISNGWSLAAMAIRGAAKGENPALATMWTLLGNPSFSIAVPTWVTVSDIPEPIGTCKMYDDVTSLFNEEPGIKGKQIKAEWVQTAVLPAESHLFAMVNERILPHWRTLGEAPDVDEMTRIEHQMAWDAYSVVHYLATALEANLAPTVDFEAQQLAGSKYKFIPGAADADGNVSSYEWNFGDGETSIKATPVHEFPGAGVYLVSVTVADDDAVTTTAWRYLTVP